MEGLPPGVVEENGQLVRYVEKVSASGEPWQSRRPVALDIKEARKQRFDYFHSELGWILEGYKLEKDRTIEDKMADTSSPVPAEPPEPEAMRSAAPPPDPETVPAASEVKVE